MHFFKHLYRPYQHGVFDKYISHRNYNVQLLKKKKQILITSRLVIYGTKATYKLAKQIAYNIMWHWNKPKATVVIQNITYIVVFKVKPYYYPGLTADMLKANRNQQHFFVRVEDDVQGVGVSLVDGVCSNTGYFKLSNIGYQGSTTEAHEYGHTLGLWPGTKDGHPPNLDQRGAGIPGIMYPRGTWVDAKYQYNPLAAAGENGGTIMPDKRRVNQIDIDMLNLSAKNWHNKNKIQLGKLTNKFHEQIYS
jgi:hypothetical protein